MRPAWLCLFLLSGARARVGVLYRNQNTAGLFGVRFGGRRRNARRTSARRLMHRPQRRRSRWGCGRRAMSTWPSSAPRPFGVHFVFGHERHAEYWMPVIDARLDSRAERRRRELPSWPEHTDRVIVANDFLSCVLALRTAGASTSETTKGASAARAKQRATFAESPLEAGPRSGARRARSAAHHGWQAPIEL